MKYNKKYLIYIHYFFTIIFIISIFSTSTLAISASEENKNIEKLNSEKRVSVSHILYSLQIVDITRKNLSKTNLDRLQYFFEDNNQELNLMYRDELVEVLGDNFEVLLDGVRESENKELIMEPKILVVPGHTAIMYVAQEELFLDVESVDSITYTNIFELELYPRNSFAEEDSVFTEINLKTGQGPTGLDTEIWIKPNIPYLLGVMKDSRTKKTKKLIGNTEVVEERYFALYLSAKPVGILTLPELSMSLAGLEKIFDEKKITKSERSILLKTAYEKENEHDYGFSLSGFYQNDLKWRTNFVINELLTSRNLIAITGHLHDDLWMGMELIVMEEDEVEIALKLKDRVVIGPFNFSAGINPLSYNFDNDSKSLDWHLRGETNSGENLQLALEYKSLSESDFIEADISYNFYNYALLIGYIQDLEVDEERAYWLGLKFNF